MQINNQIKSISEDEVSELRKKLRRGDADLIAEMLDGLYLPITISHMIRGHRKMKPIVFEAANRLIETIENLKNELK